MNNMDNDDIPDTSSPEYLMRKREEEEFRARLKKVLEDSGIPEAKDADDDSPKKDTYTITFSNGVRKPSTEPKD